jgi:hypothetical protein
MHGFSFNALSKVRRTAVTVGIGDCFKSSYSGLAIMALLLALP